jgi:competence protein ComEC
MRPPVPVRTLFFTTLLLLLLAGIISAGCTGSLPGERGSSLRANTTGDLRAYFLDAGQGDSSVILFKDKVILIDAGEAEYGDRVVRDLEKLGVTRIDLLVATHPHSDHIGGMQMVLARFPVGKVLDSGIPSSSSLYEHFLKTIDERNISYGIAERGQKIDLDPSLGILVLSSPEEQFGDDINTNSIVLRITYGTVNLLYAADATAVAEDVMERAGCPLDAQILKIGHHGSSDASSAAFLSRVNPEVAVISLGRDNEYGHPHEETLERLRAAGPLVLRTDQDGTILVRSDGKTCSVATEGGGGEIWSRPGRDTAVPPVSPTTTGTLLPSAPFTLPVTIPEIPSAFPVPSLAFPSLQIGNASSVYISAVQFDAPGDDRKNLNGEWVRLANGGDSPVLLTSWTLADRSSAAPYRFPAFLLLPGSTVTVYTGSGEMNDTSLYMGRSEPLWGNGGDMATLQDGSGSIIDARSGDGSS